MKNIIQIKKVIQMSLLILSISATASWSMESIKTLNVNKNQKIEKNLHIYLNNLRQCNLDINKTTQQDSFIFGDIGTYNIAVSNSGHSDCYSVIVSDTLPKGMAIDLSSISDGWDCEPDDRNPQTVMCYYNENLLLSGQSASPLSFDIEIPTQENSGGYGWNDSVNTATNCATVRGREFAWNKNNYRSVSTDCVDTRVTQHIENRPFKIKVDTRIDSFNHPHTQFQIPTNYDEYRYNYNVDCDSDGVNEAEGVSRNYTCNYVTPGIYTISISGIFPQIEFMSNCEHTRPDYYRVISLEQWGTIEWKSMRYSFICTKNMVGNALDTPNLSSVEDMMWMFRDSNFNQNISNWDVSNIKNMRGMFRESAFTETLSDWDVSSVTNMVDMFRTSTFNQDISDWNVSHVTNMSGMFHTSTFNQDISDWDVSSVTSMSGMFYTSTFNQDISDWNVSSVTNISIMFFKSNFNQDISGWDVSNVTNMRSIFMQNEAFNQDISDWNVSSVTNMSYMFFRSSFDQDISGWDVSNVTNMRGMFMQNEAFNQDISDWNVSSVTKMGYMFYNAYAFSNNDLSRWNVENVSTYNLFLYQAGDGNIEPNWN